MRFLPVLVFWLFAVFLSLAFQSVTPSLHDHSRAVESEMRYQSELRQDSLLQDSIATTIAVPQVPDKTSITILPVATRHSQPQHLALFIGYRGMTELPKGSNRGPTIDKWNAEFGLKAVPWCAISQSIMNRDGRASPRIWSADAKRFILKDFSYKLSDVIYGRYYPKPGDYRVKGTPGKAHVDAWVSWDTARKEGILIGGNVSDQVKMRAVTLQSMIFDGTTHITAIKGNYNYSLAQPVVKTAPVVVQTLSMTATFYHGSLHGKTTANGEQFNNKALTAAHKTLAFGTRLTVTNPATKKTVTVRVNDRIKTAGVLDLTKRAADAIGIAKGKVIVKILR